jgi:hypothetical protein
MVVNKHYVMMRIGYDRFARIEPNPPLNKHQCTNLYTIHHTHASLYILMLCFIGSEAAMYPGKRQRTGMFIVAWCIALLYAIGSMAYLVVWNLL